MIRYQPLPAGEQTLTATLTVKSAGAVAEFYVKAFNAEVVELHRVPDTDLVMHATLRIGGSTFFITDEFPNHGSLSPATTGHTSSSIHIQVAEGIDELYEQACAAGATSEMAPEDMFWGHRFAMITDPSGQKWTIGMTIANPPQVTPEELKQMMGS